MERVLYKDQWFAAIAPGTIYEHQYQQIVMAHAKSLFPGYHAVPFSPILEAEDTTARPDFALVDQFYRCWWVVEVELCTHSLEGHVLPQVKTLIQARYGIEQARALMSNAQHLNEVQVREMVRATQPNILVVVDQLSELWKNRLEQIGAHYIEVEVLRSDMDAAMLKVKGALDTLPKDEVSACRVYKPIPRCVIIDSPANLGFGRGKTVSIGFEGGRSHWTRIDIADAVLLHPEGANPLTAGVDYVLVRSEDAQLTFRRKG